MPPRRVAARATANLTAPRGTTFPSLAVTAGAAVIVAETAACTLVDTIGVACEIAEARYDER
jgi:hypothetical protein